MSTAGSQRAACVDDLAAYQFVEGQVDEARRAAILAHLETCADCHQLVADLLAAGLDSTPAGAPVEDDPASALPEVDGPYRLEARLARGGMGEIYRAVDTDLGRAVALKVPRSAAPGLLRRFEREVAITARLQHPGIVPVHGAGKLADGTPFYVMRFVEGMSLEAAVAAARTPGERLALVAHVAAVAETMAYVHAEQIAHRDIKPNNVLLGRFGETVIIDWGLAKQLSAAPERASAADIADAVRAAPTAAPVHLDSSQPPTGHTTRAGDVLGTPAFMAPEQAAGRPVDVRVDVYALGVLLAYVVSGQLLAPDDPLVWTGDAARLVPVVRCATASDREARHADAAAFLEALRAALAPPPPAPARRGRAIGLALGASVALLAGGALLAGLGSRAGAGDRPEPPPPPGARLELLDVARGDMLSLALSPSGRRLGHAGLDRVEVRDLATGQTWTRPTWPVWPRQLTFSGEDELQFVARPPLDGTRPFRARWTLSRDELADDGAVTGYPDAWVGALADGGLYMTLGPVQPMIVAGAASRRLGLGRYPVGLIAIAPDRQAFAFVDGLDRTHAVLRVSDATGAHVVASLPLVDVTAIAWASADTLLYATGASGDATLWRATATAWGLATPERIYTSPAPDPWIGAIASGGGRTLLAIVSPRAEARWLDRASGREERLPESDAAAALAWRDDATLLTWNRSTSALEERGLTATSLPTMTPARLAGDPASATRADDMIIVALRGADGRTVVALDGRTGAQRWTTPPGAMWFVRCAGDSAPPCVAGVRGARGLTELRHIDPRTGALGARVVAEANITDAALDPAGATLAWLTDNATLWRRPLAAAGPGIALPDHLGSAHSLAFVADGPDLVLGANRDGQGVYVLAGDALTRLVATPGAVVSLIRASPDGARVSYRTRTLGSQLGELHLAR